MKIQIKPPSERIKELARINDWHYGLLSRAMAVIGPHKTEEEVLLALQEAADNINLADLRATAVIGPHDAADNNNLAGIRGGASHPDNEALKLKGAKVFGYRSVADFDEVCKRPFPGYHRGKYPLADAARSEPPASCQPCDFKVGDIVTFTNDYGVAFPHKVITGFAPEAEHGRFVYYDSDAWWFPVSPESLTLEHETEYYVWCDDECQNKTSSLEEAKKWRDEFVADGRASWIVDSDSNYITDGEVDPAQTTVVVVEAEGQLIDATLAMDLQQVQALLAAGANVNAAEEDGTTALMRAAYYDHVPIAQALLEVEVDVNAVNNDGKSASDIALENGHRALAELIRSHQAQSQDETQEAAGDAP